MIGNKRNDYAVFKRALTGSELLLLLLQQLIQYRLLRIFADHIILAHHGIYYVKIVFVTQISKGMYNTKVHILLIIRDSNKTEEHNGLVQPRQDCEC